MRRNWRDELFRVGDAPRLVGCEGDGDWSGIRQSTGGGGICQTSSSPATSRNGRASAGRLCSGENHKI